MNKPYVGRSGSEGHRCLTPIIRAQHAQGSNDIKVFPNFFQLLEKGGLDVSGGGFSLLGAVGTPFSFLQANDLGG